MNYIYKITNTINQKIYIGQTRKTIKQRWSEHISAAYSNPTSSDYNYLLHKAIRKYGNTAFNIECLEEVEESQQLAEREQYWIAFYNSCILAPNAHGYNMTYGGEGSSIIDKKKVIQLWEEGLGSLAIAQQLGHSKSTIKCILQTDSLYNKELDHARNTGIRVYCYNNQGQLIAEYPSIAFAAKIIGIHPSVINKCCNHIKQSGGGYFWSYSKTATFQPMKLSTWSKKRILQQQLDGTIIRQYESFAEAGRAVNKNNTKYIKECCEGKRSQMYGYKWSYVKDNFIDNIVQSATLKEKSCTL